MNFMKKLIVILVVLTLISCEKENQTFSRNIKIVQDSVRSLKIKNIKEKDYVSSNLMYIGKIKDSVELLNNLFLPPPPEPLASSIEDLYSKNYRLKKEKKWKEIRKYFKNYNKFSLINKDKIELEFKENDTIIGFDDIDLDYYKSFPIFIKNISKDTMSLGTEGYFPVILEAKNREGKWFEINKLPRICGSFSNVVCLPPNEIIITSMFHYTGNYKTKFRLKFSDFVSREFDGSINEEQLR